MKRVNRSVLSRTGWNGNDNDDFCTGRQISICRQRMNFYPTEREEEMLQICNFFSRNFITFQALRTYTFTFAGMSTCGTEAMTTLSVMPEVDLMIGYSDNPKHICISFLC
jgi:hypothetical protein